LIPWAAPRSCLIQFSRLPVPLYLWLFFSHWTALGTSVDQTRSTSDLSISLPSNHQPMKNWNCYMNTSAPLPPQRDHCEGFHTFSQRVPMRLTPVAYLVTLIFINCLHFADSLPCSCLCFLGSCPKWATHIQILF
jgi:hypothetical protein